MKRLVLYWALAVGGVLRGGETPMVARATAVPDGSLGELILYTQKYTNTSALPPGQYDANVAALTARMLQRYHYSRHPVDDEMATRFLDRYLDLLDGQRMHFVQADIAEFEKYRPVLDDLTVKQGDTSPANLMFARLLQRVEQRVRCVVQLLQKNAFEFTGADRYTPNRKDLPWPADLEAAQDLWRQHLRYEYLQEKLNKTKPAEILKTLSTRYKRLLKTYADFDSDEILQLYLTALSQAYDPHSDYMGKAQLDNFAISMKLSLFGIGALLRSEDDYCKIHELMAGGPAAKSKKLKPNDKIIAVQQAGQEPVDVVGMKLIKVVEMIRGPKGTPVTLTIIPADAPDSSTRTTLTLIRDEIKLEDQEAKAKIIDLPDTEGKTLRVGVIDLPSFYATFDLGSSKDKAEPRSTTADVTKLIKKLTAEHVAGIVLDLRRNGGGSLEEAIKLTGLFIKEGPIVQVRGARNDVEVESDPDPAVLYDGPLVVLTSRFSASASEILAAALQDYGRALIVGDTATHGKGTVQTIYEFNRLPSLRFPTNYNPGALKVTIRKFYRATGSSTQLKGVTPDIVLPSVSNCMDVGEGSQEYALDWDNIPGAAFEKLDRVQPCLEELRRRTAARQETDKDFAYLSEDIAHYRKMLADKSVSLNEAQRLQEKAELEAKTKARKEERAARTESKARVYEITLKLADQPGLPPPLTKTNAAVAVKPVTLDSGEPVVVSNVRFEALPAVVEGQGQLAAASSQGSASIPRDPAVAPKPADAPEASDLEAEDKTPAVDVALEEAKRILLDYIALLADAKSTPIAVTNQ